MSLKLLNTLSKKPLIGPVAQRVKNQLVQHEAKRIAKHFSQYFAPIQASSDADRAQAFNIRHKVYCEELNFEPLQDDEQEKDEFDSFSMHALIRHNPTNSYAGTVRVVRPLSDGQQLPIEKYCLDSITHPSLNPASFPRHEVCEISRLAVPEQFRRRQSDKFKGAATGSINTQTYSEKELRCFPFIAIGLYLSAASLVISNDIKHTYVMMEPRLARSMGFVGIKFEQIGPVVEYHGKRAPYYINPSLLHASLTPGFKLMLQKIQQELNATDTSQISTRDLLCLTTTMPSLGILAG